LNAISGSSGTSLAAILKRKSDDEINYGCRGRIKVSLEMLESEIGPGLRMI
jgi:hypothetical protein